MTRIQRGLILAPLIVAIILSIVISPLWMIIAPLMVVVAVLCGQPLVDALVKRGHLSLAALAGAGAIASLPFLGYISSVQSDRYLLFIVFVVGVGALTGALFWAIAIFHNPELKSAEQTHRGQ